MRLAGVTRGHEGDDVVLETRPEVQGADHLIHFCDAQMCCMYLGEQGFLEGDRDEDPFAVEA